MSFTDIIIILVVLAIISAIIYRLYKKKDESYCASCSYKKDLNTKNVFKK